MSRTASPWSMVGLFIGTPKLRSFSRKLKEDVPYSGLATLNASIPSLKAAASVAEVTSADASDAVNTPLLKVPPVGAVEEHVVEGERLHDGFNLESLHESEHGWTNVSTEYPPELSSPTMSTSDLDDIVDVLSQSVSDNFLEQQSQLPHDMPSPLPFEETEGDISQLKGENKNLEERLLVALRELSDVDRRNGELEGENRRQEQEISRLKAYAKVKEEELSNAQKTELRAVKEAADFRQQCHATEATSTGYLTEMTKMKNELAMAQKGRDELTIRMEEVATQNKELHERGRRMFDEYCAKEKELDRALSITSDRDGALKAALSDLDRARKDQQDVETQLKESLIKNKEVVDQNARLQADLVVVRKELTDMRIYNAETQRNLETALDDLKSAFQDKTAVEGRIAVQGSKVAEMEKEIQSLRRLAKEMVTKNSHTDVLERQNRMLMDQLKRQSVDLRQKSPFVDIAAPRTLTSVAKADLAASALRLVNRLNSDIFQVAAHMSESLDFTFKSDVNSHDKKAAVERSSITVGRPLALLLHTLAQGSGAESHPFLIQIGLQACLVSCSAKIIASWYPGHWDYGDFIAAIYSRIVGTTPGLAARWRAITERQLKPHSEGVIQSQMEEYLLRNITDVLTVAGWRKSPENAKIFVDMFRERIARVAKSALRLNTMLGGDLEILIIHSDETFDEEKMENAYGANSGVEGDRDNQVVCTTELGLKFSGEDDMPLKPKVILQVMLTDEAEDN
ncbi:hypothetical protein C0992_004800 [Termitomyces sp. T32_za158]|nr:hypothetical protein C0992_004800 [Termitomyces sp. T32_za158]